MRNFNEVKYKLCKVLFTIYSENKPNARFLNEMQNDLF